MRKHLFLIAAFVAIAAMFGCTADTLTGSNDVGLLEGTVTIGPLCPVEHPDENCKPDPSIYTSHFLVVSRPDGSVVADHVPIAADGKYQTQLPAGRYFVDFAPKDIGLPGNFTPPEAMVDAGKTTVLNINIDTGIR